MSNQILTYCQINQEGVHLDGKLFRSFEEEGLTANLKSLYKSLELDYSKFYKMDNLSKLGVINLELMKKAHPSLFSFESDDTAVILWNNDSSLDTDVKHQEAVNKKKPSPAIFVYTLANIVIGEISIRNKWYGESAFYVSNQPDLDMMLKQIQVLTKMKKAKKLVIGWLDCFEENFKCNLALLNLENEFNSREQLETIIIE